MVLSLSRQIGTERFVFLKFIMASQVRNYKETFWSFGGLIADCT